MKVQVLLLFLVGRLTDIGAEDFCQETKTSILHDHVLIGHVISSLVTRGILSCAQRCLSLKSCSSFNYETSAARNGICELNDNQGRDVRSKVTLKRGFAFGRIHRKQRPRSCLEAWNQGARASGFYYIQVSDDHPHTIYCDLASEPGWAWTLVTSQSLCYREEQFASVGLLVDSPKNAEMANWQAYRLPLRKMEELKSQSTHWRVTCSFPTVGVDYRDYVKGEFQKFDILTFSAGRACKEVEYIDVRGYNCQQCTAAWGQKKNDFLTHRSDVNKCGRNSTPGHLDGEQTFGRYRKGRNPNFRCTSAISSTTNYWFGRKLNTRDSLD